MSYDRRFRMNALCLASVVVAAPAVAMADGLRAEIGVDYSSGKYGGALRTDILAVPVGIGYVHKAMSFKLTIPWLRVSGPGNVVPGLTPIVQDRRRGASKPEDFGEDAVASGDVTSTTSSGWGDMVASGTYNVIDDPAAWRVGLTGRVKIPTADESQNLGTGKTDYAAQVELERAFGRLSPFATIGYRWLGDTETLAFRNQPYFIVGVSYRISDALSADTSYYTSAPTLEGGSKVADVSAGLSYYITANLRLTAYVLKGLSDGSPDWGGGVRTRLSF